MDIKEEQATVVAFEGQLMEVDIDSFASDYSTSIIKENLSIVESMVAD